MENYVLAQPEKLWSKLAAERVLRPCIPLSGCRLRSHSEEGLYNFFRKTPFYRAPVRAAPESKAKIGGYSFGFSFKKKMVADGGQRVVRLQGLASGFPSSTLMPM